MNAEILTPGSLSAAETLLLQRLRQQPALQGHFEQLLEWVCAPSSDLATADAIEAVVAAELRALGLATLTHWAVGREAAVAAALRATDPTVRSRKKKVFYWWCVYGAIRVVDRVWRSATQNYVRPLPASLGMTCRGRSRRLERVLTDFGSEHTFVRAAAMVWEHYGVVVGASPVRTTTLKQAQRARVGLQAEYAAPFRALPAQGPEQIIAEADGTMICTVPSGRRRAKRPRQWEEMRLVAAVAKGSTTPVFGATFGSVAEAGQRWGHCARKAGRALPSHLHVVGDGAPWIPLQGAEVFGTQMTFLCDYYHVTEYLAGAAPTCRPGQPKAWRHIQQKRLKRGAAGQVVAALARALEPACIPEELAPVRAGHRYLLNRLDSLDYPRAIRLELPIGSGLIESGHRHVLQARLKKAGAAWVHDNADQMAHLRVLRATQEWSAFWN